MVEFWETIKLDKSQINELKFILFEMNLSVCFDANFDKQKISKELQAWFRSEKIKAFQGHLYDIMQNYDSQKQILVWYAPTDSDELLDGKWIVIDKKLAQKIINMNTFKIK